MVNNKKEKLLKLLNYIRQRIKLISKNQNNFFYNRRWIYARLQLDERKGKGKIKKFLFSKKTNRCWRCKRDIKNKKGIVLHRKNGNKGYSKENSVLIHKSCHQELHNR